MPYQIGLIEKQIKRKEKRKMESKRLKHMLKEGGQIVWETNFGIRGTGTHIIFIG
jgi:hypothetical protein